MRVLVACIVMGTILVLATSPGLDVWRRSAPGDRAHIELGKKRDLAAVLTAGPTAKGEDTALLHFDNGVQIAVPLKDAARVQLAGLLAHVDGDDARSPAWQRADQLEGVELVHMASWQRQLRVVDDPVVDRGVDVFTARCAACHAARGVGGHLGPDFVEPVPMKTLRTEDGLLFHVRFRPGDAADRGVVMPPQPGMAVDEMHALWAWLQAIGARATRPYAP